MSENQPSQSEIDVALVRALIEILPERWKNANLDISQEFHSDDTTSLALMITNPDGEKDLPQPSDDLNLVARRLALLSSQKGNKLKSAHYATSLSADGNWDFKASYFYY